MLDDSTAIYWRGRSLNEEMHTILPIVQTYGFLEYLSNFLICELLTQQNTFLDLALVFPILFQVLPFEPVPNLS